MFWPEEFSIFHTEISLQVPPLFGGPLRFSIGDNLLSSVKVFRPDTFSLPPYVNIFGGEVCAMRRAGLQVT
jgi:hypothetical protein